MKTKLIFLFLSITFFCNAQSWFKLQTFNLDDVRQLSDSVLANATETFKFVSAEAPVDNKIFYVVTYINTSDATDSLVVMFRIDMVGGTDDNVNPGTPQYLFNKITGKFSNLFPFWIRYMKPEAVEKTILDKKKDETTVKGATFDLHTESTRWAIEKF
jgi:hypothetical protein